MTWSPAPPCKSPSSTTAAACMFSSPSPSSSSSYILSLSSTSRRRFTTFCLRFNSNSSSSSPSSSSSSSSSSRNRDTGAIKKVPKSISLDTGWGLKRNDSEEATALGDIAQSQVSLNENVSLKKQMLGSIKAFFGRRSLWQRRKWRSIVLLNLITIIYASNIPVVKEVEAIVDPAAFTVVRFAVCAIPFLPFVIEARDDVHTRNAGMELGFWLSLGYLMQAIGLLTSDAGRASFISMFTVIVVPLLDGMLGAVVPALTWLGAVMSLLGVALLESSGSPPRIGDLMNFLGAVFFGIHMLRTQHISRSTNKSNFVALLGYEVCVVTLISTLWYFVGGCVGGIRASDLSSWTSTMVWHSMAVFPWIPALYTGLFSTGLCLWIEMAAMRDVSATETAIIYGLEPVWGAGFAWFLLGERWAATGWIGAALVIGGSLTVQIFGSSVGTSGEDDRNNTVSPTDYR